MSTIPSSSDPSSPATPAAGQEVRRSGKERPAAYHSYLLRLWRDQAPDGWHASLQSTKTGERHSFADLDSLLAFLLMRAQGLEE